MPPHSCWQLLVLLLQVAELFRDIVIRAINAQSKRFGAEDDDFKLRG